MRYDDRLATVLGQPAADARGKAVQWRQLVELLSLGEGEISDDLAERALARVAQLMKDQPLDLVTATSRAIAGRPVPAELVALFASRGATASAALLTAADLTPAGWKAVRLVADDDVLPLLAALGHASTGITSTGITSTIEPPITIPTPLSVDDPVVTPAPWPEVLERAKVERREPVPDLLPLPAGLFRWETSHTGDIDWVDGAPRSAIVGRSVAESFAQAFSARLPFEDEPLVIAEDGKLAGEWRWSGAPTFFADTGRFAGYRGVARREGSVAEPGAENTGGSLPAQDDGLREVMHELRTPLNAIIGFGEVIEGQYLGPAHRVYRDRASEIVRQARRLSDAVDNLDLAARLRSGRMSGDRTSDAGIVGAVLNDVSVAAAERDVHLAIADRGENTRLALPRLLVERLVRQFATAMIASAATGERLGVVLDRLDGHLAVGIDRAPAMRGLSEQQLLANRETAGTGFALRLVQGLASMVGGRFDIGTERLWLLLPLHR